MRLTLVQSALHWENAEANRQMFTEKLVSLQGKTDLVVLPEMFTTGFSMLAQRLAEPMDGPTVQWMLKTAASLNAAVTGSFICMDAGRCFNRLVFVKPDGAISHYDKRHLFSLAGEDRDFERGNKKLVVNWAGFRIMPLICYDLRFPVWSRNTSEAPYDLLLYVANWPNRRAHHWKSLLAARAIENQSFVAGVNVVGVDGNNLNYSGDSALVDFSGQTIVQISDKEDLVTTELSLADMSTYRQQLPFLSDADAFAWPA